nr:MAG: nonstructural protein [Microviridae sp.]
MAGIYAIFDVIAEEAGDPFMAKNDGIAIRNFNNLFKGKPVKIEDYRLYYLGIYDPETMDIDADTDPQRIDTQVQESQKEIG